MRPTATRRGIKGLFPLVRSLAPAAISSPFPLQSLRGLRLAIDATLVIQRLHFADDPHPGRHLIGFYRLVNSMRENGVQPIMIFDHPEKRLALKDREQDKRRKKRELDRVRNRLESERKVRLRALQGVLDTLGRASPQERAEVGRLLHSWRSEERDNGNNATDVDAELAEKLAFEHLAARDLSEWDSRSIELWEQARDAVLSPLTGPRVEEPQSEDTEISRDPQHLESDNAELLMELGRRAGSEPVSGAETATEPAAPEPASSADDLYDLAGDENLVSFERQPISGAEQMTSRPSQGEWEQVLEDLTSRPFALALRVDRSQRQFESALQEMGEFQSKGQKELTEIEHKLYAQITNSLLPRQSHPSVASTKPSAGTAATGTPFTADSAAAAPASSQKDVANTLEKGISAASQLEAEALTAEEEEAEPILPSSVSPLRTLNRGLSKTYARSTTPLLTSTYSDCAHLCSLMSVPVFWTGDGTRSGGGRIHEAEAYAASLVKAGYADVVASEDSDVLLYEAPLLRGLVGGIRLSHPAPGGSSAGKRLMEIVDGAAVRKLFFAPDTLRSLYQRRQREAIEASSAEATESGKRKARRRSPSKLKTMLLSPAALTAVEGAQGAPADAKAEEAARGTEDAPAPDLTPDEYERTSRAMMLDFALLCGTDFNRTVPGIGPKTALKLIQQHGSVAAVLEKHAKKFQPPAGLSIKAYDSELREARAVFLHPPKVRLTARSVFAALNSASRALKRGRVEAGHAVASDALGAASTDDWTRFFQDSTNDAARPDTDGADGISTGPMSSRNDDTEADVEQAVDAASSSDDGSEIAAERQADEATASNPPYDKQAVLDYLREKGVFGSAKPLGGAGQWRNDDSWRDIMDLELGIDTSAARRFEAHSHEDHDVEYDDPEAGLAEEQEDGAKATVTGSERLLMGVDFFGEKQAGSACWSPEMEMNIKRSTTIPERLD